MRRELQSTLKGLVFFSFILLNTNSFSQTYQWANRIGSTGDDYGYSVAVDTSGDVYVAGFFSGTADFDPGAGVANLTSAGGHDIFFAKYDADGNYLWAHSIGSTGDDNAAGVALDGSGNVYITGTFYGTTDFDPGAGVANLTYAGGAYGDLFIAKYDGVAGNYVWAKGIGSNPGADRGQSIAVDGSGNAYITGYFTGTADFDPGAGSANLTSLGGQDIFFAKYDPDGNFVWAHSIGSSLPNKNDIGYGIALDNTGTYVYITGTFNSSIIPSVGTADFDPDSAGTATLTTNGNWADIFLAKYGAAFGNYAWGFNVGSPYPDYAQGVTVDGKGNVYVIGEFQGSADFDPDSSVTAIVSASGNILTPFFAKYDSSGNYAWADAIVNPGGSYGYGIAVDPDATYIYVTGFFNTSADFDPDSSGTAILTSVGSNDIFFGKYDATNGNYVWAEDIGSTLPDFGASIAVDGTSCNIYISGYFNETADFDPSVGTANLTSAGDYDIYFGKYSSCVPLSVENDLTSGSSQLILFPNPGHHDFSIRNISGECALRIFDPLSRTVYSEKLSGKKEHHIHLNLSPGIYLLQFTDEAKKTIQKLIIE